MNLGELIIKIGTEGNTKELEKALKKMKEAEKETAAQIKLNKDLSKATSDEEKALIKKNYAQKQEIASTEKMIQKGKERNKTLMAGIQGFTRFIGAVSLTIGVLDRLVNASAKANQSILTLSQTSGIDVNTINQYASAAKSVNYNVTREQVARTFESLAQQIMSMQYTESGVSQLSSAIALLSSLSGETIDYFGKNPVELIEAIRGPISKLNDMKASYVLNQMGISPDLLPMLRMSKSEFNSVKNRFLSDSDMVEEQKRSLKLQEQRDELNKLKESTEIQLYPLLNSIYSSLESILPELVKLVPATVKLAEELIPLVTKLLPVLTVLIKVIDKSIEGWTMLIDFISNMFNINKSVLKPLTQEERQKLIEKGVDLSKFSPDWFNIQGLVPSRHNAVNNNLSDNRNINIYTTQSPSSVIKDSDNILTYLQVQPGAM